MKGATWSYVLVVYHNRGFNPRAHEGRDGRSAAHYKDCYSFNPRAHEGRDGQSDLIRTAVERFNPRAHEGRDREGRRRMKMKTVSIHAPMKGATPPPSIATSDAGFQSTRP